MTKFFKLDPDKIQEEIISRAALVINEGGLVAFPTETVYGLGADGLNESSVAKIYEAKGRPSDNPLILHIHDKAEVKPLVKSVTKTAKTLMDAFWPGPITLIFEKSEIVPDSVSGGLNTVAIRLPENEIARQLIKYAKTPIAAPSANTSGRPSPTKASHVFEDLNGKIDMILDGGSCEIGLESTVVDVTSDTPVILRPGKITIEQIRALFPDTCYDRHLIDKSETVKPKSPGMKYKHYAPRGELYVLNGGIDKVREYILSHSDDKTAVLSFADRPIGTENEYFLGDMNNPQAGSRLLFDYLRLFDTLDIKTIFALLPPSDGMGFALCNRLFKAAGGRIINVEE